MLAGSEQGFGFPQGDRGQVPRGTQATAPESGLFPLILSRHERDAPPGRRVFLFPFHPLDRKKNQNNFSSFGFQVSNFWFKTETLGPKTRNPKLSFSEREE
ncbi:MAG: hypothetical protein AMJ94_03340 [Deltaproteobacteria bacterium SM23_61]|nr:MAG: hypothetical protein AMJ94_03340 [Deltaproteobacteria bacterium SM23_61]